jgi:hypothetical protein
VAEDQLAVFPCKQSTSLDVVVFAFDASGDGVTGKVDGDWTKRISKGGAAFAAMTVTVSERENGFYALTLSSSHTDTLGVLTVSLSATGVKRVNLQWRVHARVPDDLAYPATSGRSMDVDASGGVEVGSFQNGAITAAAFTAGAIDAAAIATDAIGAAELADGAITAATFAAGAIDAAAIATDAIGASEFSQAAADKVWSSSTRTLSAFGFTVTVATNNDKSGYSLSAAGVQAVWDALTSALSTANSVGKLLVDNVNATISSRATQTSVDTIDDFVDTEVAAIKAKTDNLPASPAATGDIPTATQNADALLDRAAGVETGWTLRQSMRVMLSSLAGKLSGAATNTVTIRDVGDTKNRVTASVDPDGNRTAVTLDAS